MKRITHPFPLLIFVIAASAILASSIAQRRARLSDVRCRQEKVLSELVMTANQAVYLRAKRHELLTNPSTIAEIAKEQYRYVWEDGDKIEFKSDISPDKELPIRVRIVDSGPERFLGDGTYIWTIPVAAAGLCAAVFGFLGVFEKKYEWKIR